MMYHIIMNVKRPWGDERLYDPLSHARLCLRSTAQGAVVLAYVHGARGP